MFSIGFSPHLRRLLNPFFLSAVAANLFICAHLAAQTQQLPYMNSGPNSVFAQVDFARTFAEQQAWEETEVKLQSNLIDSGVVSALDLQAPDKAVREFKQGSSALKAQNCQEAIRAFQRAVKIYPDFVSAHNALGLAYMDERDPRAREEFETAAKLDERFPGPLLNLGLLAIAANDFEGADTNLVKAANLTPHDPWILTALAFAENGDHRYQESIRTVNQVHALEHRGFANAHYIAAAAAMSLGDLGSAQSQLRTFLSEDPANPLAPVVRQRLEAFANGKMLTDPARDPVGIEEVPAPAHVRRVTFPNTEYLKNQVDSVANGPDFHDCESCSPARDLAAPVESSTTSASEDPVTGFTASEKLFTIHQFVDETALFFSVSNHGHTISDLSLSDIDIRDDHKAPEKILQFIPQSKLPLRLGLLIDTSQSVKDRMAFEKRAAEKFIEKVLDNSSDLAFVEGFQNQVSVTQDFTRDPAKLAEGIQSLAAGGDGTAIFDAVFLACWKLSAYPDQARTARVLVVLTDGEDNSSHRSLRQAIEEAEAAGVTVYTVSTREKLDEETDSNRVLKLMAERTGGEFLFPGSLHSLDYSLKQLQSAIRSRYLIAYKPADFKPNGRFRPIRVRAEKDGSSLRVQVRKGYYARASATPN